jgi:ubiquinone/menaquinone biosynthesis C-methylase UbiE
MTDAEVAEFWNRNAPAWTAMSRAGYDVCRDGFNTPRFVELLGDIRGKDVLDIGCGEGANTRTLARLGPRSVHAVDIAEAFLIAASDEETRRPLGIRYARASAQALPFGEAHFDVATSFMCMMDLPDQPAAFAEAHRVLRPGGVFQFSIIHPCFSSQRKTLRDENRRAYGVQTGAYFERTEGDVERWTFGSAPDAVKAKHPLFEVPRFHRTLAEWINMLLDAGLTIERLAEPRPDQAAIARWPHLYDEYVIPLFLHIRCRKA